MNPKHAVKAPSSKRDLGFAGSEFPVALGFTGLLGFTVFLGFRV